MENNIKIFAKDIAKIRKSGKVNMFDKKKVSDYLLEYDCKNTAIYVKSLSIKEYIFLLNLSADF